MKHILSILLIAFTATVSAQVTLVGNSSGGSSVVVEAGDSLTTSNATVTLSARITGSPTNYYWTHNGLGSIADSTSKRTTYTVNASDTVIWFDIVAFYNFRGILDTIYDRRVVTIPE